MLVGHGTVHEVAIHEPNRPTLAYCFNAGEILTLLWLVHAAATAPYQTPTIHIRYRIHREGALCPSQDVRTAYTYPILYYTCLSYPILPLLCLCICLSYPIYILYLSYTYPICMVCHPIYVTQAYSGPHRARQYDIHTRPIPYLIHMNTLSVSIRGVWIPSMVPARFEPICRKAEALRQTCHAACLFDLGFVYPNFSRVI